MKNYYLVIIIFLSMCVTTCAQSGIKNDFYLGLKGGDNAVRHFENALASSNSFVRQAASQELAAMMARGIKLSQRTEQRVRREAGGSWAEAYKAVENLPDREKSISFLLNIDIAREVPEEAKLFILKESEKKLSLFSETELAAIDGHYAVLHLRYNEALLFFRAFQQDDEWPEHIPEIFVKNPVLITDLGRALQYTSSGLEGMNLFLQWEKNLIAAHTPSALDEARFRLLFYAARIARRNGRTGQADSLFRRCMPMAPSATQKDACIWYILDLSLSEPDVFIKQLEELVPLKHDSRGINDILEKFLQALCAKQDWKRIIQTHNVIKDSSASIKSGYAWVAVRAIEEGFVSGMEKDAFLQSAYNAPGGDITTAFYYHSLSAAVLEKPLFPEYLPEMPHARNRNSASGARARNANTQSAFASSPAVQFILGFFIHDAKENAHRYILQMEKELTLEELRIAAGALSNAGMYVQAIRLVTRYMGREDYSPSRRDLELLFPRVYNELVEKYAKETGIAPQVLYALIRTESAFQDAVVSRAGAVGLTQLIPATALDMASRIRRAGGPDYVTKDEEQKSVINLNDPETNIHIGAYYLSYLDGRFNDRVLSLLAYNGGMNRIRRLYAASKLPTDFFMEALSISETRDYGRKVLGSAAVYKELYYNP